MVSGQFSCTLPVVRSGSDLALSSCFCFSLSLKSRKLAQLMYRHSPGKNSTNRVKETVDEFSSFQPCGGRTRRNFLCSFLEGFERTGPRLPHNALCSTRCQLLSAPLFLFPSLFPCSSCLVYLLGHYLWLSPYIGLYFGGQVGV